MKQLILILFVLIFAFCSCCKTDDNQQATSKESAAVVDDAQNPFKILGEVKSAKLVFYSWITREEYSLELNNPSKLPELLFVTKEEVPSECVSTSKIIFTTTTGKHTVYIDPVECTLGEYQEGIPRIIYSYSHEIYEMIYERIKSFVKPDQPHHKDNLIAGSALCMYFEYIDSKKYDEAIELMRNYLNGNDLEFDDRENIEEMIRSHDRKQTDK